MPVANYDALFGGQPGSAAKARASMIKTYGMAKGTRVFYAVVNERRKRQHKTRQVAAPGSGRGH